MKVSTQRLPESQVLLEVEVESEQMERSLERAYRKLAQRVAVPGFRKGKAPRPMLERHVGRDRLLQEALETLIPEAYNRAIDEQQVEAIGEPAVELVQREPLVFKATVPVRPTVDLGDYHSLRVERMPMPVDAAEVDTALEELRHRYAIQEPVERPVQTGDVVRVDVRGLVDGHEAFVEQDKEFRLREGAPTIVLGFAEALLGAQKGVAKEVTLDLPSDYPQRDLAGKSCAFTILVKEVKEERLPQLDDQFAREVGEGFPSLQALRERLAADLRQRREMEADEVYRRKAVEALVEQAEKIEFPPILVEQEIGRLLRDQARAVGQDVDSHLQMMRSMDDELREAIRPAAVERVRRSLALSRLAEMEQIQVEPAETDAEIERLVSSSGPYAERFLQMFFTPGGRDSVERSLLTSKTLDRLVEIAGQEPASLTAEKGPERSAEEGTEEES